MLYTVFIFGFFLLITLSFLYFSLKQSQDSLQKTFKSLSYDVLAQNNQNFLQLAKANFDKYHLGFKSEMEFKQKELEKILQPVKESIEKIDQYTKEVERQRISAYAALNTQINTLIENEKLLKEETANLSKALKSPNTKGAWGQIHLKRVVELSGLLNNCDFYEQKSIEKEDKVYRPDLIIRLPGSKNIIVDAKTPIDAYLEMQDQPQSIKEQKQKQHALSLKKHINDLSSKEYFSKFDVCCEYVILFLPAEAILSSAITVEPNLLELAANKNIIIATPTTLIAILKTIAQIWKEDNISKKANQIAGIGKELYERLITMNTYFSKVGKNLSMSVEAYNQTIASFNTRVMVSARKLKDLGLSSKESDLKELSKTCDLSSLDHF